MLILILAALFSSPAHAAPEKTAAAKPRSEKLRCKPTDLKSSSDLTISLPAEHGGDLAIVNPKGDYFFLAFKPSTDKGSLQPMIAEAVLKGGRSFSFPVDSLKTQNSSRQGSRAEEKVFEKAGRYKVLLSAALETEDPVLDGWCEVDFNP